MPMRPVASMPLLAEPVKTTSWKRHYSLGDRLGENVTKVVLEDVPPVAVLGIVSRVAKKRMSKVVSIVNLAGLDDDLDFSEDKPTGDDALYLDEEGGGFTISLVVASALAVLPVMQFGFNNASMNTAAGPMRRDIGIPISGGAENDSMWGWCVSIFCLGAMVGCNAGGSLADKTGLKRSILVTSLVFCLGSLLEVLSKFPGCESPPCLMGEGVELMLAGRFVAGMGAGASTVVIPMYLGEVAPPALRGTLGTVFQLSCVVGMLLAQVLGLPTMMGTEDLWASYVMLVVIPALILLPLQFWLPESPRWLATHRPDQAEKGKAVLAALRGKMPGNDEIEQEYQAMSASVSTRPKNAQAEGLFSVLWDPAVYPGLPICLVCSAVQQLSGINNAFNYSQLVLKQNGVSAEAIEVITYLMNFGNLFTTLLSTYLMDAAGRRTLLLGSASIMAVSILGLTLGLVSPGESWTTPVIIVSVVMFVMSFGMGMGPIPWLLPAELIPPAKLARCASLSAMSNWFSNFVVGLTFPIMSNFLSGYCFFPFFGVIFGFLMYAAAMLPETKGKTLDQILYELRGNNDAERPSE